MPDDGISPCADDPLVGQLAGILRRMVRVNTALLTDEGVVSTVFSGKCASALGLEEQERHRRLEPGRQHWAESGEPDRW